MGHEWKKPLPQLRDLDQPYPFDIKLYNRPYRFELYDTASPTNFTLLRPAVLVMCFSIGDPASLESLKTYWKRLVEEHYNYNEMLPVIVLGLQRDVRNKEDYNGHVHQMASGDDSDKTVLNGRTFVYPQEGLKLAQEMRCDRYCECSAVTGELCREVIEDISKTAALTTTEDGGKSKDASCTIM